MAEGPEIDSKEYYKKSNFIDGRISDNSEKRYGLRTKMNLTFESTQSAFKNYFILIQVEELYTLVTENIDEQLKTIFDRC